MTWMKGIVRRLKKFFYIICCGGYQMFWVAFREKETKLTRFRKMPRT